MIRLVKTTLLAALLVSPATLMAESLDEAVQDEVVQEPEDHGAAILVGNLNTGVVAGAAAIAAVILVATSGSSTSGTN